MLPTVVLYVCLSVCYAFTAHSSTDFDEIGTGIDCFSGKDICDFISRTIKEFLQESKKCNPSGRSRGQHYFQLLDTAKTELSILAPEIICPESDSTLGRPDYSMIRILSESNTDMDIKWSVSWSPLTAATQRLTIMTWKSVRDLEKKLNGPQAEPLLSVIKNDELISGVNYTLNLTAISSDEIIRKSFSIKYNKDNQDATVSTDDAFSVMLLGGRSTFADLPFAIEADVTTCSSKQDFYFAWELYSTTFTHYVDVSNIIGSRLELARYDLRPGAYYVNCQLRNDSTDVLIKEVKLPIHVHSRGLRIFLSVDHLIISKDSDFSIKSLVLSHDYEDHPAEYEWKCFTKGESCNFIENSNDNSFNFSSGIPIIGEYLITLTVVASNLSANANATIDVVKPNLPILQIEPVSRMINQGNITTLVGKAFRVAPSCSVTWYFAAEGFLNKSESHGIAISETHTVFSLEENFLNELADFSNDTASVEIEVDVTTEGRVRLVAECNCTFSSDCESIDVTYAEVDFQLNESPKVEDLKIIHDVKVMSELTFRVLPESGSALETLFQIRALAKDIHTPLRYSFYCAIGPNVTLLLGSYLEYDMVETFLPFIDGETIIWIEVCDALGACSKSETSNIRVLPSSGKTFDSLVENARAFIRRCETIRLMHVAISAFVSYKNAGQWELADLFTRTLLESLPALHSGCWLPQYRYAGILGQLTAAGFDVAPLLA